MLPFIVLAPFVAGGVVGSAYGRFRRKRLAVQVAHKPDNSTELVAKAPDGGENLPWNENLVHTRYSQRAANIALGLSATGALFFIGLGLASVPVFGYSAYLLGSVFLITLALTFCRALSGLGAAGLLIPVYFLFGFPINTAKSFALFANILSLSAATTDNLRSDRIDLKLGLPIIISSFLFAPVGALVATLIETNLMMMLFAAFLLYVGVSVLWPRKQRKTKDRDDQDKRPRLSRLLGIGSFAGLISGLFGVGGGGVITPLMLWMGSNAKKIAIITALAVPFTSLAGFVTYAAEGYVAWPVLATIGIAAFIGGYAGNKTLHTCLPEKLVKYLMGIVSLLFAFEILYSVTL